MISGVISALQNSMDWATDKTRNVAKDPAATLISYRDSMITSISNIALNIRLTFGPIYTGDCRNGQGVCRWFSGDCYEGSWLNGKMHGQGIFRSLFSGYRYEGNWYENRKQGPFILTVGEDKLEIAFENDIPIPKYSIDGMAIAHTHSLVPTYALIVQSTDDHNGVFSNTKELDSIKTQLKKITTEVIVKNIGSLKELSELKLGSLYENRVSHVVIRAHGCSTGMQFGSLATIEDFKPLLNQLAPSPLIVLAGCSTAEASLEEGVSSIAEQIANHANHATVIAANCPITTTGFFGEKHKTHTTLKVAMIGWKSLRGVMKKIVAPVALEAGSSIAEQPINSET